MSQETQRVSIEQQHEEVGVIVRFKRESWSEILKAMYLKLELIVVVRPEMMPMLEQDLELYRQLDDTKQADFLEQLRVSHYVGRLLGDSSILPDEITT